jgi:hypothetical protein
MRTRHMLPLALLAVVIACHPGNSPPSGETQVNGLAIVGERTPAGVNDGGNTPGPALSGQLTTPSPSATKRWWPASGARDDSSAFDIAFNALFTQNPPFSTGDVTGARFVWTEPNVAEFIVLGETEGRFSSRPGWLFVFTGQFQKTWRFRPEAAIVAYSTFVFVPLGKDSGWIVLATRPYDLSPGGVAINVPDEVVLARMELVRCRRSIARENDQPCVRASDQLEP